MLARSTAGVVVPCAFRCLKLSSVAPAPLPSRATFVASTARKSMQQPLPAATGVEVQVNRCPFGHGSVGVGPFPVYMHGTCPAICPSGCKPDQGLGKYGHECETPRQTLVREALEYQEIYHRDKATAAGAKERRISEILAEIEATGSYTHTFDELEHGARVAWRNAPKCSNRKFWEELRLVDGRHATTPGEMFAVCLDVLERATVTCCTTANIGVFRAQAPGTADGPRVWNSQLIRFAGYRAPGSNVVLGDPAEADFTSMLTQHFAWSPPGGTPGRFDVLPLVLQAHPNQDPQLFELPSQYVVRVPIRHPSNEAISALGLQWYAVPAVSCLELSVGGLTYTAAPFNGWYADTEIVRNLTDESRFNLTPEIAARLGLDTKNDATMWRDRAIVEVDVAVMHSFREAGMGMVDHHTLMRNFFKWYEKEKARRGFVPGNWKWIIPPVSPTASRCYLELNKMTEFTLKPGYWYAPGWRKYFKAWRPGVQLIGHKQLGTLASMTGASKVVGAAAATPQRRTIFIAYASVTGTSQAYAEAVARLLGQEFTWQISLLNMEDFEADSWAAALAEATLLVVMSSTYGPGAPPGTATKFLAWLQKSRGEAQEALTGKPFSVLGFGSSSYPRFCAAADLLHSMLLSVGAAALLPVAKADALAGEEGVVWPWLKQLADKMLAKGWADAAAIAGLIEKVPINDTDSVPVFKPEFSMATIKGDGLQPARERGCHWATLLEVTELLGDTHGGASTKLLRFNIENVACGSYYAGDEMSVWGENEPAVVEEFAAQLGIAPDCLDDMFLMQKIQATLKKGISLDGDPDAADDAASSLRFPLPNTFRTILLRHVGLTERISYSAVCALSPCALQDQRLQQLAGSYSAYTEWVAEVAPRWQDLFRLFPSLVGRIPLATLFQIVPPIKPRYYSISSSSAVSAGEVAICVGKLRYTMHTGEQRSGFCSSFLTGLAPGSRVRFKLVSQPAFRLPLNLSAPVVMVAAGTGLAPFRGFWQERLLRLQQQQQLGPGVLVFGCRSKEADFLFSETLEEMVRLGSISKVLTSFSRQRGVPKTYVQDLISQRADELCHLLQHPLCHVYVCGSSNMAQEVSRAVAKVAGKEVHEAMVGNGRWHEDVFGITIANHQAATKAAQKSLAIKTLSSQPLADVLARIETGVDINAVDEGGSTLLHHVCAANRLDVATVLLARGAVPSLVNRFGLTPAAEAALAGHTRLVTVLGLHGGLRVGALHAGFYPLHAAVMAEDLAAVQAALQQGADPSQRDYLMVTPLHIAVVLGSHAIAEALLAAGASPSAQNQLGMTPLQLAIARDNSAMAELLRSHGAVVRAEHVTAAVSSSDGCWSAESNEGLAALGVSGDDVARVRASWAYASGEAYPEKVQAVLEDLGVRLFLALFEMHPHLLSLFPFKDAEGQPIISELKVHGLKVASTLGEVVERLQNVETLDRYVTDLVERHVKYGVQLMHYDIVLGAILAFLGQVLPDALNDEDKAAWGRVLHLIKAVAEREYAKGSNVQTNG